MPIKRVFKKNWNLTPTQGFVAGMFPPLSSIAEVMKQRDIVSFFKSIRDKNLDVTKH